MFCIKCGRPLSDDARFCGACGAPVGRPDEEAPSGVLPSAPTHTPVVPPPDPATSGPATSEPVTSGPATSGPVPSPYPGAPAAAQISTHAAVSGSPPSLGPQAAAPPPPPPPPPPSPPPPPLRPPSRQHPPRRTGLWIGLAVGAVIVVAAAVAVPLIVLRGDNGNTQTTTVLHTTSTAAPTTTLTAAASTSTSTSTSASTSTTVAPPGAPGDSPGEWVELEPLALPTPTWEAAVSDQALLVDAKSDDGFDLWAYLFDTAMLIKMPIGPYDFFGANIDGSLAVWCEGDFDENLGEYNNQRIYAFRLPDGPKVEVAAREAMSYPKVKDGWITWVEGAPWEENPDEYWRLRIYGVQVDPNGNPKGTPVELVSSAAAFMLGDSVWTYDLSATHLAWEQATPVDVFDTGTYMMDLNTRQPLIIGNEVWRPSLGGGKLVYYGDGVKATDLVTGRVYDIDPRGDFPTAAATFVTYFRGIYDDDGSSYEIVARGYEGLHEQVLAHQYDPPWFSPLIAASDTHVAFVVDGVPHVFRWQGR